jgi:hypothetical protein
MCIKRQVRFKVNYSCVLVGGLPVPKIVMLYIFWDIKPYSPLKIDISEEHGGSIVRVEEYAMQVAHYVGHEVLTVVAMKSSTLKMEATCYFETG